MKRFMTTLGVFIAVMLFASLALAGTIRDRMTYEGPVTFKGTVTTSGAVTQSGAQTFTGTLNANGNTVIGDAATDTVTIGATILGTSPLIFEGTTADAYETTLTVTDPTADRTITFPNQTGTASINCTASHDYAAAAVDWTLTAAEAACSAISVTNANGAVNAILPAAVPGKLFTVINGSGQTLTFKVTGQTGGTVATAKWALYTTIAADTAEVYELP